MLTNSHSSDAMPQNVKARFENVPMGRDAIFLDFHQEGDTIVIRWNTDHPFYENLILKNYEKMTAERFDDENTEAKEFMKNLDYLAFSYASAMLVVLNQTNTATWVAEFNTIMSKNLKALTV